MAEQVVNTIVEAAHVGKSATAIFVSDVERIIRIRTGETDGDAI